MTATAEKWFVPDDKYKLGNQDYVCCLARANLVQNVVDRFNDMEVPIPYVTHDAFSQKLALAATLFHTHDAGGSLIFADAHGEDEKLWQKILEDIAKEQLLDEPSESHKINMQEFIEHSRKCSKANLESAGGPSGKELRKMAIHRSYYGALDPEYVGYLLEKRKSDYQRSLLQHLSGQDLVHKPRPVMLLIGAIVDPWLSTTQRKTGIAMGYDFATDKIIIKSFSFDLAQHPFAQCWFVRESENSFYLSQTPEEFAASDLFVAEETSNPKQSNDILIAKYIVGIWVEYHAETLKISKEVVENLQASMDMIKRDQTGILLPEEKIQSPKPDIVYEFAAMHRELQQEEDHLRSLAARAKKEGCTVAAENMAKFFEMSVTALKEITENPDAPLTM
ncbi:hypothetical protein MMC27_008666 [Xylographa pallens]|nr:hypothetical protein [Xylographa pallens]